MIRTDSNLASLVRHGLAIGLILGTMFCIALLENKSWGILMGIGAIVVTKYVYVTIPARLEESSQADPEE